ncbi:NUDIX hydrolase [Zafaria sp. Z1313]|uniref:NUDIX hydrolase n=1 Tax=unclassified Zafaria TaxID=2828765 RepID=UPI002E7969BD|nr:NUDIX domain-containing protein [Zafaria sp. J156]MEE1619934.1 NUDIX domain-containing protein [Zafaria sp. J156]
MPTPDFILELRARIGTHPLWLPGVKAVVHRGDGAVLLVKRVDNGRWTVPAGILEPGEEPAGAAVREVQEETGVRCVVERLAGVGTTAPVTYPNGDRAQYLDVVFACRYVGGEARVNDDENSEVAWFAPGEVPELPPLHRRAIDWALSADPAARFVG